MFNLTLRVLVLYILKTSFMLISQCKLTAPSPVQVCPSLSLSLSLITHTCQSGKCLNRLQSYAQLPESKPR